MTLWTRATVKKIIGEEVYQIGPLAYEKSQRSFPGGGSSAVNSPQLGLVQWSDRRTTSAS